jgi:hypothetical protein
MKKNSGMFFWLPCWRMGAVLLALCAFTPVSRADVIIDNTSGSFAGSDLGDTYAQVFTMPGYGGTISSLTLVLGFNYTTSPAEVDLYSFNGSLPGSQIGSALGTVSAGSSGNVTVGLTSFPVLSSGVSYAIVLQNPSSGFIAWNFTADPSANTGDGTLGGQYSSGDNGVSWGLIVNSSGDYFQMSLQTSPVPEVPMTGAVMGFGVLSIAMCHTLRRKIRPAVSSIA